MIEYLCQKHPNKNIVTSLFWKKLYIIQTKEETQNVLSKDADTTITFPNNNFFASHDHSYGIGNIDQNDWKWQRIHKTLAQALGDSHNIIDSIERNKHILVGKHGFQYNANKVLKEYTMAVWADFCFGPKTSYEKYNTMQKLLITTLRKTFYNHTSRTVPYIGFWMATMRKWYYSNDLQKIDQMLYDLLKSKEGFMGRFYSILQTEFYDINTINKIVLDNAFLSVLAFDFLYIVIVNAIIDISKQKLSSTDRLMNRMKYIHKGFLFPNRIRYNTKTGDYYILNLLKAELPFSFGPRSCIGPLITNKFYEHTMNILKDFTIESIDRNPIIHDHDPNIPNIISQHIIKLSLPQDYVQTHVPFYPKNNLKFYRMEAICENPMLLNYIIDKMAKRVDELNIDVIVTADARGFLFASPVASKTNKPLVIMRKSGKLAGPVTGSSYCKSYDSVETLEISMDSNIKNKRIAIIDDGIASGGTTEAMHNLIMKQEGKLIEVIVSVKHSYCQCKYSHTPVFCLFMN